MKGFDRMINTGKDRLPDINAYYRDLEAKLAMGEPCAVLQIDVSFLRGINRTFGRAAGDLLLKTTRERLLSCFPDIPVYLTKEIRFLVITDPTDYAKAAALQKILSLPVEYNDMQLIPGIRVVFVNSREGDDYSLLSALLMHASGKQELLKNRVVEADETLRNETVESGYLMEELRFAIQNQTFEIWYQPVYDLHTEAFVSAEALARLRDRQGNFISPGRFIPFAERRYLIDPITEIVVGKVCEFLGQNPDLPITSVSVNLTPDQIHDPNLPSRLAEVTKNFGTSMEKLRLEMTERSVQDDLAGAMAVMEEVNSLGSGFYLDDFGSGYSNLSSVMQLPFEAIKFDKTIADRLDDAVHARMISLLAQMMHIGNRKIIFEGIESDAQDAYCRENGFDRIQGYRYAKPLPADEFKSLILS